MTSRDPISAEELAHLELATHRMASNDAQRREAVRARLAYAEGLRRAGKTTEAGIQHRRALSAADQVFGKDTVDAAEVALATARFYVDDEQLKDAEPLLRRALGAFERAADRRAAEVRQELEALLVARGAPVDLTPAPVKAPPPKPVPVTPAGQGLAARVARGELSLERLRTAAVAGHAAARDALCGPGPFQLLLEAHASSLYRTKLVVPDEASLAAWVGLFGAGEGAVHAALVAAELVAPSWRKEAPTSSAHDDAIALAKRFLAARDSVDASACNAAADACYALAKTLSKSGFTRGGRMCGLCSGAHLAWLCSGLLDASGRSSASTTVDEAVRELAWVPGKKGRTKKRLAAAEAQVRAAIAPVMIAWALGPQR